MVKINNKKKLKQIIDELERIQEDVSDVVKLDDDKELHTEVDIYDQLRDVINNIEEMM